MASVMKENKILTEHARDYSVAPFKKNKTDPSTIK